MPQWRIYVDKKIKADGTGGEHSRVFDIDAPDEAAALEALKLKKDEDVNQIVSIYLGDQAPALTGELLVEFYLARLAELGYDTPKIERV